MLLVALSLATLGLRGGNPVAADALWEHAIAESDGDLGHDLFVDAQRELALIRPWQSGFSLSRERMRRIGEAQDER